LNGRPDVRGERENGKKRWTTFLEKTKKVDKEMEVTPSKEQKILEAFEDTDTSGKLQIVKGLLNVLKDKNIQVKNLEEVNYQMFKSKKVEDQLKTLSSLTGLLNLFKTNKEILQLFEGILLSLLHAFEDNREFEVHP